MINSLDEALSLAAQANNYICEYFDEHPCMEICDKRDLWWALDDCNMLQMWEEEPRDEVLFDPFYEEDIIYGRAGIKVKDDYTLVYVREGAGDKAAYVLDNSIQVEVPWDDD